MVRKKVTVAMVGMGWAGNMHAQSYQKITGLDVRLKTVCAAEPINQIQEFAEKYGFEGISQNLDEVLQDPEIDIVDITTPPALHKSMIIKAFQAGKHVICEKPLTGYFGDGTTDTPGFDSKELMYEKVVSEIAEIEEAAKASKKQLCYAENWIYSPPFVRAAELLKEKKTSILAIHAEEGHKGSHAGHAGYWKANGGGTLIRQGTHPIGAALWLKREEARAKGEEYKIVSVLCDCACIAGQKSKEEKRAVAVTSVDIEDWAQVIITFQDGTKAAVTAADIFLSQVYNRMHIFGNDAVYEVNMTPNNLLETYWADDAGNEDAYIVEKNDRNIGWQHALVIEDVIRGYVGELQDFLEAAATGRAPKSDFGIAKDVLTVVYAAYLSAERKCEVTLS